MNHPFKAWKGEENFSLQHNPPEVFNNDLFLSAITTSPVKTCLILFYYIVIHCLYQCSLIGDHRRSYTLINTHLCYIIVCYKQFINWLYTAYYDK